MPHHAPVARVAQTYDKAAQHNCGSLHQNVDHPMHNEEETLRGGNQRCSYGEYSLEHALMCKNVNEYTKREKEVLICLLHYIHCKMRNKLGLKLRDALPGPHESQNAQAVVDHTTGERIMQVDLTRGNLESLNARFIDHIAACVFADLQDPVTRHQGLVKLPYDCVAHITQMSFDSLLLKYKVQTELRDKTVIKDAARAKRREERRKNKASTRLLAVPTFISKMGFDPTDVIREDYMSDEDSGPDDDDVRIPKGDRETWREWKARMIQHGRLQGDFWDIEVVEVLPHRSRGPQLTALFHCLSEIHEANNPDPPHIAKVYAYRH